MLSVVCCFQFSSRNDNQVMCWKLSIVGEEFQQCCGLSWSSCCVGDVSNNSSSDLVKIESRRDCDAHSFWFPVWSTCISVSMSQHCLTLWGVSDTFDKLNTHWDCLHLLRPLWRFYPYQLVSIAALKRFLCVASMIYEQWILCKVSTYCIRWCVLIPYSI